MEISATYLCPVRGVAGFEAPDPARLGRAAGIAKSLGVGRLEFPVLEESIAGTVRAKIRLLDGLIRCLDRVAEAGMIARLIAPAQRVLGLYWAPPYLLRSFQNEKDCPVFTAGEVRPLRPLEWWGNPLVMEKRISSFREVLNAVSGHPALEGWVVLDRALSWPRPEPEGAEYFFRSLTAEIRQRDEKGPIYLGIGWSELLDPPLVQGLVRDVHGVRIGNLEEPLPGLEGPAGLAGDLLIAAYMGALAQWLFERPAEIEIGWGLMGGQEESDEISASGRRLSEQGTAGVVWANLVDPEPPLRREPPWLLRPGVERVGLLQQDLEPKPWVEGLSRELHASRGRGDASNFIDLSPEEFLEDPQTHFSRLWGHFLKGA